MDQSAGKNRLSLRSPKLVLLGALLAGAMLLVYWPAISGGFIWDDDAYVTNNPLLTAPDGWQRIWFSAHSQSQFFPLAFSTLRIEHLLWGVNPLGYHLFNVLLHSVNAALIWLVLKRLSVPCAWLAAALFALHPVQVESVAWVTELKNVESAFFCLLTVLAWMGFLRAGRVSCWRFYSLTLACYLLALCSKTTACTLPAVMLLIPWMQGERIGWRRMAQVIPFLALGVAAGLVSIWWEAHLGNYREDVGQSLTLIQRVLVASHALWFYALKLMWPVNLTFSYPHWQANANDWINYLWPTACLAVGLGLWRWRARIGRRAIPAVIFFVATLLPLVGFIPLYTFRYSYVADHYQYIACVGLLALAATGLHRLPRVFPGAVLVLLATLTWRQAHIYHDQTVLWQDTLVKNPGSWMAHNNLGEVFKNEGNFEAAIHEYEQALELKPDFAAGHYNLGIALFKNGLKMEAIAQLEEAIRQDPQDSLAHYNYAIALAGTGKPDEAGHQYEEAIRLKPDYADARINLGIILSSEGKLQAALSQFQEAVRLVPDNVEARNDLGAVLRANGQIDDAIRQFRIAIHLNPNHALAHSNLGGSLLQKNEIDEAITQLQEALRLNSLDDASRIDLARALQMKNAATVR